MGGFIYNNAMLVEDENPPRQFHMLICFVIACFLHLIYYRDHLIATIRNYNFHDYTNNQ